MKKLNQHLLLAAAMMLLAGSAYAQTGGPTNQLNHTPAAPVAPTAPGGPNANLTFANGTGFSTSRADYVQDSYVEQAGTSNYAKVTQSDNRTGSNRNLSGVGSSASIVQTGDFGNATQNQTLDGTSNVAGLRNEAGINQKGYYNSAAQTQAGGSNNTARVTQDAGTQFSQATQTQTGGSNNSASISQSKFNNDPSSDNTAIQTQTGGSNNAAAIRQQSSLSRAIQTQTGTNGSVDINQGARGQYNQAEQVQSGDQNKARITQSVNFPQEDFDHNYAKQTQSGSNNSADINQRANHSYAEQVQSGSLNRSLIMQGMDNTASNVRSAAYTTQSGSMNSASVSQQ